MEPEIRVTRINNRWHARLFYNDVCIDEMACENKLDIGWVCREMLRWYAKGLYPLSEFAEAARRRQTSRPFRKIWYKGQLENQRIRKENGKGTHSTDKN